MKRFLKFMSTLLIIIAIAAALVAYGIWHFSYDLNAVKPGDEILRSVFPSGEYAITAYLNNGGATTGFAVLCQLEYGDHIKNIYWNYHCKEAEIVWLDDNSVIINGITLDDVEKDTYDFRREK